MTRKRKIEKDIRCPPEYGLDVFGGKWKSRIVCVLSDGPLRYGAKWEDVVYCAKRLFSTHFFLGVFLLLFK